MPPGLERPTLLVKTEVTYPARAWAMRSGGVVLATCVINLDGSLSNCRITHSVPGMDEPVLLSLKNWRFTPVVYHGHPQRVLMTIPIRIPTPE